MGTTTQPEDGIVLEDNGTRGRYLLGVDAGAKAEMTFGRDADGTMTIDHTFVPPRSRGKGVAGKLVARAVDDARQAGVRIVPLCPYVAAEFRRHPEWSDLLAS